MKLKPHRSISNPPPPPPRLLRVGLIITRGTIAPFWWGQDDELCRKYAVLTKSTKLKRVHDRSLWILVVMMSGVVYLCVCNVLQLYWFFLVEDSGLWQLEPVVKWTYVVATVGAIVVEFPTVSGYLQPSPRIYKFSIYKFSI